MKILIADDDRDVASVLNSAITICDHEVVATVTTGGLDVIQAFVDCKPDVVFMDVMMPRFNGLTICHALLSRNPQAKVVLMSGKYEATHPFITNSGATAFLPKPIYFCDINRVLSEIDCKNS